MPKTLFTVYLIPLLLGSCGTMQTVKQSASNATQSLAQFSISDLRPSSIDVVEVRENELKEIISGKEKALAFDRKNKRSFWSFTLPNFEEPSLPKTNDAASDGSLLPPKPL